MPLNQCSALPTTLSSILFRRKNYSSVLSERQPSSLFKLNYIQRRGHQVHDLQISNRTMKKQLEVLALIIIIFLISVIYRERATPKLVMSPTIENENNSGKEVMLYLFLFFSKNNCPPCLRVIDILNQPGRHFLPSLASSHC